MWNRFSILIKNIQNWKRRKKSETRNEPEEKKRAKKTIFIMDTNKSNTYYFLMTISIHIYSDAETEMIYAERSLCAVLILIIMFLVVLCFLSLIVRFSFAVYRLRVWLWNFGLVNRWPDCCSMLVWLVVLLAFVAVNKRRIKSDQPNYIASEFNI